MSGFSACHLRAGVKVVRRKPFLPDCCRDHQGPSACSHTAGRAAAAAAGVVVEGSEECR